MLQGYTFFTVWFYLLVLGVVLSIALSAWVAKQVQENNVSNNW